MTDPPPHKRARADVDLTINKQTTKMSGKSALLKPDLELYYEAPVITADNNNAPRHALRILALKTSAEPGLVPCTELIPGWSKAFGSVNLFLEAGLQTSVPRQCHLQFAPGSAATGGSIRGQLALHLGVDDVLTIQLEYQKLCSRSDTNMINREEGTCRRSRASWLDITFDDRSPINMTIPASDNPTPGDHRWIRVSNVEYILIDIADQGLTAAVTPDRNALVGDIRTMASKLCSITVESMHAELFDQEELWDEVPLLAAGIAPQMVINCRVEWVECVTCGEDEIPYLEFSIPITSTCTHDRQTCKACTQRWISTKLDKGDWDKINCPGDCPATLQPEDMRNLATPEQLERYQHLSFRSALGNMPDFVWCMAPGCDSGQIHTQEDGTILNCVACNSKSCVDCNRLWHEGETCEDYKLRTGTTEDHEKASEAEVLKISKECPGCKMRLQKEGGCEHITCRRCNYQFCWLCLVSYIDINKDGAFAHKPTCMYHDGSVPDPHNVQGRFGRPPPPLGMPGNPPGYRYQPVHPLPDQDPLPRFPLAPPPGLLNVQPYLHPEIYQGHEPRINDPLARHQRIAELNARLAVLGEQQRQMQQRQIQQQEMHLADGRARNIVQMDNQLREMRERLNQRVQRQREVMDQMDNIRNGPNAAHVNLQQLQGIDPVRPNRLAPIPVPGMPGREQLLDQMAALEPALPEREQVDFLDWMQQMRAGTRPGAPPGFPPDNHVANQAAELDRQRRTAEMERRVRSAYHRTGRSARQDRERERQAQQVPQPRQRDQNLTHQNLRRHDLLPDDAAPGPEFVARRAPVAPQFPRAFPAPVPPQAPAPPPAPRPIPQNVMPAVGVQQILEPAVPRRNRDNRPVIIEISSDEEDG